MVQMRIAFFTESYFPQFGGIISYISQLSTALNSLGHEVLIVAGDPQRTTVRQEGTVLYCPTKPAKRISGIHAAIRAQLESFEPEMLHVHTASAIAKCAIDYAGRNDLPMLYTIHDTYEQYLRYYSSGLWEPLMNMKMNIQLRNLIANADVICSPSTEVKRFLADHKIRRDCILVRESADQERFDGAAPMILKQQLRLTWNIPRERRVALFAGRFVSERQVDELVELWSQSVSANFPIHLVILGDGPIRGKLRHHVADLGMNEFVTFADPVLLQDMPLCYAACDLFVSAATDDEFSMAASEAMLCGLPVLIPASAKNASQVKNGVNGFLYHSARDFGNLIKRFSSLDDEGYRLLKKLVRSNTASYSPEKQALEVLELYQQAHRLHNYDGNDTRK
jgi:1,2-diacylglycerol 3-alpha-glucosyltransferase